MALISIALILLFAIPQPLQKPTPRPSESANYDEREAQDKESVSEHNDRNTKPRTAIANQSNSSDNHQNEDAHRKRENADSPSYWWGFISTIVVAIATALLAGVAVIQACLMAAQHRTIRHQLRYARMALSESRKATSAAIESAAAATKSVLVAEESLRLSQRAYVHVVGIIIDNLGAEKTPSNTIQTTNSGPTVAHVDGLKFVLGVASGLPDQPDYFKQPHAAPTEIVPGVPIDWHVDYGAYAISRQNMESIERGRLRLYIYGAWEYRDVFGHPHTTRFGMRYDLRHQGFVFCSEPGYNYSD
jgi:hypothetical protein